MYLQDEYLNGNITESELSELLNMTKKEKELTEVCNIDLNKIKTRSDDNRAYIYIKRKQYVEHDRKALIDLLYDEFINVETLERVYRKWLLYCRDETKKSVKTLKEHASLWDNYLSKTSLASKKIRDITTNDIHKFYCQITNGSQMKLKRFTDLRTVVNGIFNYAMNNHLIQKNVLNDINYKDYNFKPVNNNTVIKALTISEVKILKSFLTNIIDVYALATRFALCIPVRIGELKALKWDDIFTIQLSHKRITCIRIQNQALEVQEMNDDLTFTSRKVEVVDYIKGKTEQGFRNIPLNDEALAILDEAKKLNKNSDFIFSVNGKLFTTTTFDRHLAKFCKKANISNKSSHDLRFTTASMYYYAGIPLPKIQEYLGHTTLVMTLHYLRDILGNDTDLLEKINNLPA